jgi:hypothetical protein
VAIITVKIRKILIKKRRRTPLDKAMEDSLLCLTKPILMENQQHPHQNFSFAGLLKSLSVAFENLFVSESAKEFRRWKSFIAS